MWYSCTLTLSFNTNVQSFFLMSSYLHSQKLQIFCRVSTFTLVFSHLIFHFSRGLIVRHVQQISSFDASTRQKCQKNFLISAVSGCRSLSSFSQNYVKVGDYKKSVSSVVGVSRGKRGRGFRAGGPVLPSLLSELFFLSSLSLYYQVDLCNLPGLPLLS